MADSRFEKSLDDVSESSEENEAAEAINDETFAEYPQEGLESVAGCNCKSKCSLPLTEKDGKQRGCPRKGYNLKCGSACKCGTSKHPCSNKVMPEAAPLSSVAETHNEPSVEDILKSLDHERLLEFAVIAFTSRRLLLNDLVGNSSQAVTSCSQQVSVAPPFCVCGWCREMTTDRERVCCKEKRRCRSQTESFSNICIDSDNISTAIRSMADTYVFTPVYDNRSMRHAAYRQYVMWQHGHLGKGQRVVIPSCCVWQIRKHYPSADGQYTGFKSRR